jgi:hypothetical protein
VLDDIAVGPVFEQPARENAPPSVAAMIEHDQLNKSARFLRRFPLGGAFAGTQANDGPPDPDTLTRFQRDVADQPVALVEQAEKRHALFHRSDAGIGIVSAGSRARFGNRTVVGGRRRGLFGLTVTRTGRQKRDAGQQDDGETKRHAASGVQA